MQRSLALVGTLFLCAVLLIGSSSAMSQSEAYEQYMKQQQGDQPKSKNAKPGANNANSRAIELGLAPGPSRSSGSAWSKVRASLGNPGGFSENGFVNNGVPNFVSTSSTSAKAGEGLSGILGVNLANARGGQ